MSYFASCGVLIRNDQLATILLDQTAEQWNIHSDIPVFGMSVITNEAHDDYAEEYVNDGDDVVVAADAAADKMTNLFARLIETL